MGSLSEKLGGLKYTPKPQSPMMAGAIINVGGDSVADWTSRNWFECDGSEYPQADYAQLYAQIGDKYNTGGETAGYFRVPNGPRKTVEVGLGNFSAFTGSTTLSKASVEQDSLGVWYFNFVITGTTSASAANVSLSFASLGLAFDWAGGGSGRYTFVAGGTTSQPMRSYVSSTTNIQYATGGGTGTSWGGSGRIRLTAKPTDAFVSQDSRFSTFDEALESIPMIKAYSDEGSVSVSTAQATATKLGTVKLNSEFAAGDSVYGLVQANRWQRTNVSSLVNSSGTFMSFDNLVVGRKYRVWGLFRVVLGTTAGSNLRLQIKHDGNLVSGGRSQTTGTTSIEDGYLVEAVFKATTTTVEFDSTASANATIQVPSANESSFGMIEELNNYADETSAFTP